MSTPQLTAATLAKDSPMRAAFPDGVIPLSRPDTVLAQLGEGNERHTADVYLLALASCTAEQRDAMACLMASMGQGSVEEARAFLESSPEVPVRKHNVSSVWFSLRNFI